MSDNSKAYVMPKAEVSDWVLFYAHDGAPATPAMVTKVGANCLTLWVLSPGYGGTDRFSVHHKSDPGLLEFPDWVKAGTWEHANNRYAQLFERISVLERRLTELEGRRSK